MASTIIHYGMGQYRFNLLSDLMEVDTSSGEEKPDNKLTPYSLDDNGEVINYANNKIHPYPIERSDNGGEFFSDVVIDLGEDAANHLQPEQAYFFEFSIPQDLNYDQSIVVKLVDNEEDITNTSANYQYIRTINVPKKAASEQEGTYLVALKGYYEAAKEPDEQWVEQVDCGAVEILNSIVNNDEEWEEQARTRFVPDPSNPQQATIENYTLLQGTNQAGNKQYRLFYPKQVDGVWYYTWGVEGQSSRFTKDTRPLLLGYNDQYMAADWHSEIGNAVYTTFKLIITPKVTAQSFRYIVLSMVSIPEDMDILDNYTSEEKKLLISGDGFSGVIHGRRIRLDMVDNNHTWKLYKLKNLVGITADYPIPSVLYGLSKVGIWSHPELMFAINGEELKVGPSGYYELKDYEIDTLSVMAQSARDLFTIDYEYPLESADSDDDTVEDEDSGE